MFDAHVRDYAWHLFEIRWGWAETTKNPPGMNRGAVKEDTGSNLPASLEHHATVSKPPYPAGVKSRSEPADEYDQENRHPDQPEQGHDPFRHGAPT